MGKYFIRKAELGALLLSAGILFAGAISAMPKISLSVHVNNPQGAVDLRIESLRINLAGLRFCTTPGLLSLPAPVTDANNSELWAGPHATALN